MGKKEIHGRGSHRPELIAAAFLALSCASAAAGTYQRRLFFRAPWGKGPHQIGRIVNDPKTDPDGDDVAPDVFAVGPSGMVAVEDGVNDRIVELGRDGMIAHVIPLKTERMHDLAIGPTGTLFAAPDNVVALRPDGRRLFSISVPKGAYYFTQVEALPDGGCLAILSTDEKGEMALQLWTVGEDGKVLSRKPSTWDDETLAVTRGRITMTNDGKTSRLFRADGTPLGGTRPWGLVVGADKAGGPLFLTSDPDGEHWLAVKLDENGREEGRARIIDNMLHDPFSLNGTFIRVADDGSFFVMPGDALAPDFRIYKYQWTP